MAATKHNPLHRKLLTALVVLLGLGASAAFFFASRPKQVPLPAAVAPAPAPAPTANQPSAAVTPPASGEVAQATTPPPETNPAENKAEEKPAAPAPAANAPADAPPATPAEARPALRVRTQPALTPAALGSLDPASGHKARIEFTPVGAGVETITLTDFKAQVGKPEPYAVQRKRTYTNAAGEQVVIASLATLGVEIDGEYVDLYSVGANESRWRETGVGAFEAIIESAEGKPVARVEKAFILKPGTLDITVSQRVVNLTEAPIGVRVYQYGPVELETDPASYGIDPRRLRYGYLTNPQTDPSRQVVVSDTKLTARATVAAPVTEAVRQIWPTPDSAKAGQELVWLALTNRYFGFAVHSLPAETALAAGQAAEKRLLAVETAHRALVGVTPAMAAARGATREAGVLVVQLNSPKITAAPEQSADVSIGAYAGPLLTASLNATPVEQALGLSGLVVYNLGGMCAPCTFAWLANPLIWFLRFAHQYIVFDWSLAIMLLVLCVRTVLHPVTRRSQIGLARFSKQMAGLAPKQAALREKYKDDPKRMQAEMARLMKEEGVSFTGALGCLPMFLQTPVWIALYAMLFFAFELRHQPGFFGVFQAVSGGKWSFLADLSAPDHLIDFATAYSVPGLSTMLGKISGINILPLLLGVVFFIQQKYLTPPPTTAMTPEQETQQKIMKVMMVVMFPLMMYNAPSGLALYFITNSTLGILESRYIRSHITALDLKGAGSGASPGGGPGKGPARKPGFLDRVRAEAQKRVESQKKARGYGGQGSSGKFGGPGGGFGNGKGRGPKNPGRGPR